MQKVVIFGALTAVFFLSTPATRAQNADEVKKLRREIELLKKEIELLKREIELLKREAKAKPGEDTGIKTGAKSRTQAFVGGVEYKLVKCVRHPKERDRVIFSFAARHDGTGGDTRSTIHLCKSLSLTTGGGAALKGRLVDGPKDNVWLEDKEWSRFQVTFVGVGKDVTDFAEVGLVMGSLLGIPRAPVKFYRIKIEPK
jgi:hypothetical protein